jgi:hypothetical protein
MEFSDTRLAHEDRRVAGRLAMKLLMTLLVRDEEDILEAILDYSFYQGVDFVLVTDNLSEDRTPQILERYARHQRLAWRRETDDDYAQRKWVTSMARAAATDYGADWVINSDADEFWWPIEGSLKSVLEAVPPDVGGVAVPRYNFIPMPEVDNRPFYERMTVRMTNSVHADGAPLGPKAVHRAHPKIWVSQGNHRVKGDGLGPVVPTVSLEILHFPMRSYTQFENKIINGGRAYLRNTDKALFGRHWRKLYETYLAGQLADYYADNIPAPEDVTKGLREGRYVEDTRIRDTLKRGVGTRRSAKEPGHRS